MTRGLLGLCAAAAIVAGTAAVEAQARPPQGKPAPAAAPAAAAKVADDYLIGPEDVLTIQFWRDEAMSGDVVVRPDGKITVRLLNDLQAAGLTIPQLRDLLMQEGRKFLEDPAVTVAAKQINSRQVMVMGEVQRQGPIKLNQPLTVLDAIGLAGGLTEFAEAGNISIFRIENGQTKALPFDYNAIKSRKKLELNVLLKPGDKIVVP